MSLTQYVAIVSETNQLTASDLTTVAAAVDKQVKRDFNIAWRVVASVSAFATLDDVPTDYWPVVIKDQIPYDAQGIHLDKDGQPFALIAWSAEWGLTASHETLEMLADPFGNRLVAGESPKEGQGRVNFLVEVCDPSEAAQFGYSVNGVLVSDFYFPSFFDPVRGTGVRYSYTDAIKQPRQVLPGGYLSWELPATREWWQMTWFTGDKPQFRSLGVFDAKYGNLRAFIDHHTLAPLEGRAKEAASALRATTVFSKRATVVTASKKRAGFLRAQIADLLKR